MLAVADDLHIMNPLVAQAIKARDPEPLKKIAIRCREVGVLAMDINLGPLGKNAEEIITFTIETVQNNFSGRLMLDSLQPEVLAAGIRACSTPPIINGFSLEESKLAKILPLASQHGTDIVGFLIDEKGQIPLGAGERLAVASRLVEKAKESGVPSDKIIIDPVLVPLSWQNGTEYNRELLHAMQVLDQLFEKPVRTMAGLSNLTSGSPGGLARERVEAAFIFMLAASKLDYILMNISRRSNLSALHMNQLLLGDKVFAWQEVGDNAK
jgi:5-methyltetrahydrofolate corrinoid/iron sulfur protein methyltransferase